MTMRPCSTGSAPNSAFFLSTEVPRRFGNPVIEEVVGLGFERVGADRNDGVGEFGVLVAVVQFAHAHVARGMDFGIVGRTIVDADVLHLHAPK